jgi:hypothetical protein
MLKKSKTNRIKKSIIVTLKKPTLVKSRKKSKKISRKVQKNFLKLQCTIIPDKKPKISKKKAKKVSKRKSPKKISKRKVSKRKSPKKTTKKKVSKRTPKMKKLKSTKKKISKPKRKVTKKVSKRKRVIKQKIKDDIIQDIVPRQIDDEFFCGKFISKEECEDQMDSEGLRRCRFLLKERKCEKLPEQFKRRATLGVGGDSEYIKYEAKPGVLDLSHFEFKDKVKPEVKVGRISEQSKQLLSKRLQGKNDEDIFCQGFSSKEECEDQMDSEGLRRCRFLLKERKCEKLPEQFKRRATLGVGGDAEYVKYEVKPGKLDMSIFGVKEKVKPEVKVGRISEQSKQLLSKRLQG